MFRENQGQIAVEYLLIFAVSIMILIVFTLPLADLAINKTTDVSDALNVKSQLTKLASGINQVYGQGQGAKQTITLDLDQNVNINIYTHSISAKVIFNDKSSKLIKVSHDSDCISGILKLNKGKNTIVVEWPENQDRIAVYKK